MLSFFPLPSTHGQEEAHVLCLFFCRHTYDGNYDDIPMIDENRRQFSEECLSLEASRVRCQGFSQRGVQLSYARPFLEEMQGKFT